MIVLKFGGTSVSTKERIETIRDIVLKQQNKKPIVVVSAIRGVTDLLLLLPSVSLIKQKKILQQIKIIHINFINSFEEKVAKEMLSFVDFTIENIQKLLSKKNNSIKFSDKIVSYGEIMSSYLIAKAMCFYGISAEQVVATSCIVTDENFGSAEFIPKATEKMTKQKFIPLIEKNIVPILTGFIGSTEKGETTTLGRGGSDYSAAIIGYALSAEEIQIWTDVDGIYTSDPRFIKDARLLSNVSYREASELAAFGAKVLHPRTIRPAIQKGIPVRVLNTLNPDAKGTLIKEKITGTKRVAAIASKKKITLVNLYTEEMLLRKGFLAKVFDVFAKYNISVDLVSVSEVSVSVSLNNSDNLPSAVSELKTFANITTSNEFGMVSLVGEGIGSLRSVMKKIFSVLDKYNVTAKMISQSAANINISLVIPTSSVDEIVSALHKTMIVKKGAL